MPLAHEKVLQNRLPAQVGKSSIPLMAYSIKAGTKKSPFCPLDTDLDTEKQA